MTSINSLRWRAASSQKSWVHWRDPTPRLGVLEGGEAGQFSPVPASEGRGEGGSSPGWPVGAQCPLNPDFRNPEEGAGDGELEGRDSGPSYSLS